MPQREFIDHLTHIEPIGKCRFDSEIFCFRIFYTNCRDINFFKNYLILDGAVLIDHEYLEDDRSVAIQLVTVLRYGREDDEVMGLNMSREVCLASIVINKKTSLDRLTQAQVTYCKSNFFKCP